jgi:hypothetical protein
MCCAQPNPSRDRKGVVLCCAQPNPSRDRKGVVMCLTNRYSGECPPLLKGQIFRRFAEYTGTGQIPVWVHRAAAHAHFIM